jgi:hypothetical protein
MPVNDFAINPLLGVVMGTARPVSPADEPHGGPSPRGDGDGVSGHQSAQEIGEKRKSGIANFIRKNGEVPRVGTEGLSPPVRHLLTYQGGAWCGSREQHLTAYVDLVTCPTCLREPRGGRERWLLPNAQRG